jgi:hypothetical protein
MVMDTLVFHTSLLVVLPQPDAVMENGIALSERSVMMETLLMATDAPSLASVRVVCQRVTELAIQATQPLLFSHLDQSSQVDSPTALPQSFQVDHQPVSHIQ